MSELALSIAVNLGLGVLLYSIMVWRRVDDSARLTGTADALERFRVHFPGTVGPVTLFTDRCGALIDLTGDSKVGLVQRHARRWTARMIAPGDLDGVRQTVDGAIELHVRDFGWPRVRICIADEAAQAMWCARLNALAARDAASMPDGRHA